MDSKCVAMVGLPDSGKTTFLAALWHVVNDISSQHSLKFSKLNEDNFEYLNEIVRVWRSATKQEHTKMGTTNLVSMNLAGSQSMEITLTFPDVSGESFQGMWERRECDKQLAAIIQQSNSVLLFIHADAIKHPVWIADINALAELIEAQPADNAEVPGVPEVQVAREWEPNDSPTQVQIIDLLQSLNSSGIANDIDKIAVVFSAWDKVDSEGISPADFLVQSMPLLDQYLRNSNDRYSHKVFGISAQGGDFAIEEVAERLRDCDNPSNWIKVVSQDGTTSDLTTPIAWLLSEVP